MTARTQKTTKVTDEERLASLPDLKRQIRSTDPNLSAREVERRALVAAGLPPGDEVDLDDVPSGGRPRAAARKAAEGSSRAARRVAPVITSSGARKTIFGVMALSLVFGIVRDIRSGSAALTDVIPRRVIGTLVASFLLMILAGPLPRVARGLAILAGFTIVALNQDTISLIGSRTGQEGQLKETTVPESGPR